MKALGINKDKVHNSDSENSDDDQFGSQGKGRGGKKQSNTIMQQINSFSLTPMNDVIAKQTIVDHKYLLELVENRVAICFYACSNRNQSLFNALIEFINEEQGELENYSDDGKSQDFDKSQSNQGQGNKLRLQKQTSKLGAGGDPLLEELFKKISATYDFMSIVMYPTLNSRREFVHDCWMVAKATENEELKLAISRDPYFYLTREDLLALLKTEDNGMITHILETSCKLYIREDISYKLISIKSSQVDKNQMTPVRLLDFISVMVLNKREDNNDMDSQILFNHQTILDFLKFHERFAEPEEIMKVFILSRRFRLSLQYIEISQTPFNIEFFTNSIESNSYEIAFYLLQRYEEEIYADFNISIMAHVKSYQLNVQFLKSKLHMSKMMLSIFSFNAAKIFLEIIDEKVDEANLEANLFTHNNNPLLCMCLLYELLQNIIKKFYSLNNACKKIMDRIMNMAQLYIESVDEENFLTTVMLEKDYSGRDALRICVELELLELIQNIKIEAIIKRIHNSNFMQDGNIYQMSTTYQICFGDKLNNADIERQFRFYKINRREIATTPQSMWQFEIFKDSLNARINGVGITLLAFLMFTCIFFQIVIDNVSTKKPYMIQLKEYHHGLVHSDNDTDIEIMLVASDEIFELLGDSADTLYSAFSIVKVLCVLNLSFFFQDVVIGIVTKRLGRFFEFPTLTHFSDLILFVTSIWVFQWIVTEIDQNVNADKTVSVTQKRQIIMANFERNIDYPFQYLFSVIVICLIYRLSTLLQFSESVGPLYKILGKMSQDLGSFIILYLIICVGFALIGNINFVSDSLMFENFLQSILTVVDASMGNFTFQLKQENLEDSEDVASDGKSSVSGTSGFATNLYVVWVFLAVVIFNMILANLIIAILGNTYNIFDQRSSGLYLSKILMSRDEMTYDQNFGAFLCGLPPLNLIQVPFLPVALSMRENDDMLIKLNQTVTKIQYIIFIMCFQVVVTIVSIVLIPVAWIIGTIDKAKSIQQTDTKQQIVMNFGAFIFLGPLILLIDTMADIYYFWILMFKTKMQQIIIEREKSTINHRSLRQLMGISKGFSESKIKSAHSSQFISIFRDNFKVIQNILFLMIGQVVPEGGFVDDSTMKGNFTFKSMKTQELKDVRKQELLQLDDEPQYMTSKECLEQFNMVKRILVNFAFRQRGKLILCTDIINDTMDEMRCERKIKMVLNGQKVNEYINANMTELNLYDEEVLNQQMTDMELNGEVRYMISEKIRWRKNFAQEMSILRLDYIFKVLRVIYKTKATISDPDAFKDKIKKMLRAQRRAKKQKFKRADSKSSFASMYSKSQRTGISDGSASGKSSQGGEDNTDDYDDEQDDSFATSAAQRDPVMQAFGTLFESIQEKVTTAAEQRLYALEIQQRLHARNNEQQLKSNGFVQQKSFQSNISKNPESQ